MSAVAGLVLVLAAGFGLRWRSPGPARANPPVARGATTLEGVVQVMPSATVTPVEGKPVVVGAFDPEWLALAQLQHEVGLISRHNPIAHDAAYAAFGPIASSFSPRRERPLAGLGLAVSPLWTTSEE